MAEQTICFTEQEAFAIAWALYDASYHALDADQLSAAAQYEFLIDLVRGRIDEQRPRD